MSAILNVDALVSSLVGTQFEDGVVSHAAMAYSRHQAALELMNLPPDIVALAITSQKLGSAVEASMVLVQALHEPTMPEAWRRKWVRLKTRMRDVQTSVQGCIYRSGAWYSVGAWRLGALKEAKFRGRSDVFEVRDDLPEGAENVAHQW